MRVSSLVAPAAFIGLTSAAAVAKRNFGIPHEDGFPYPSDEQLLLISKDAGGKLPNDAATVPLGPISTVTLQLIAFNELFEVSYFNSLLSNITSKAEGYTELGMFTEAAEKTIEVVLAQEKLHAIGALATLKASGAFVPDPCQYQFPVNDLQGAITLAETFTVVVLGALQGASVNFATEGNNRLVRIISSIIGQEGEQNGAYRLFLKEVPSEKPFLTYVPAAFAWSALQLFVVPGSCPYDLSKIALPIFPGLNVNGGTIAVVEGKDQTLTFTATLDEDCHEAKNKQTEGLYITFVAGQQVPISVPAKNVHWEGHHFTAEADFPYEDLLADGFSHASLTNAKDFASADAIVANTLAAPAVLQVKIPL